MYNTLSSWMSKTRDHLYSSADIETKHQRLKYLAIGSISVLTIAYCISLYKQNKRNKQNSELEAYFSNTYYSARDKFRNAASKISTAKQHSIIIDTERDLSIDLCYIPGDKTSQHVVIHFCGTHGVEGYAGSAIQIYLLQNEIQQIINSKAHILFVHTLNPFGMAHNRRWNKANIDLNRNCLLNKELWDTVKNRDPNKSGYVEMNNLLNPCRKPTWFRDDFLFWWEAIKNILIYGMETLKKSIVEGQYFKKDGLFYGGMDISAEHDMLVQFLTEQSIENDKFEVDLCEIGEKLTIIDVHTGLGSSGKDSLLIDNGSNKLKKLLPKYAAERDRIQDIGSNGFYKEIYSDSVGLVTAKHGYLSLFKKSVDTIAIVQEFGTVSPVKVFKALRAENMAYHYSKGESVEDDKQFYLRGLDVKNVFYPQNDPVWKNKVLLSGVEVFKKLVAR